MLIVILKKSKNVFSVPDNWVENPNTRNLTKIFFGNDTSQNADNREIEKNVL